MKTNRNNQVDTASTKPRNSLLGGWLRKLAVLPMAALTLGLLTNQARAEELIGWEVNGLGSYGASPLTPTTLAAHLTAVGLTRGSAVGTSGTAAANAWGGNAWTDGSEADAINANHFATFSVTAGAGYGVSFTTISAYNIRHSSTGPKTGIWQYQVGSGAFTDIGSAITWGSGTTSTGNSEPAIDLSGIADLQNVATGTPVTFRIVNWGGTGSSGTWYINNISGHDLQIQGTVAPVGPPPPPVANDPTTITSSAFIAGWSASTGATGYQLDVATDSGFNSLLAGYNNLDVANVTSTMVSGLSAGTTYYFRVRAYNGSGTSDNSNVKSATTTVVVASTKMTVTLPGETAANTGTTTTQTAGTPFNVTLTAVLADGITADTTYSGPKAITFSGPAGSPVYPATVDFTAGTGTAAITLTKAETTALTATDGLLTGIVSSSLTVAPATYVWVATAGTASWTDATSWQPNRIAPGAEDTLLFNQGGNSTVTGVANTTIANLIVSNATTITLQAGAVSTLTVAGGVKAFALAGDSTVNVSGSSALTISLPTGSSASLSGAVDFAGGAHKLLAVDAGAITFQAGATFTADTGFTSNPFGTANLNSVVFASGSTFVQKAGSNPFGASAPSSVVVFQTGSLFRVAASFAPSFSGRTYADLEINASAYSQSSTGGNALTLDNLTVTAGTVKLNLTGGINIKGNVTVAAGQSLNFTPATSGNVTFNGPAPQVINNSGTLSFGANSAVIVAGGSIVNLQGSLNTSGTIAVDGTLTGAGAIAGSGSTVISSSGTLSPGTPLGTLTFDTAPTLNGSSTLELDRSASPNADKVVLTGGTFTCIGTLTVVNHGAALVAGDAFTLFAAPGFAGTFTETNLPTLATGLGWDTSTLGTDGTIKVIASSVPSVPPQLGAITFSDGKLIITGTNNLGSAGTFTLLTTTDLALSPASWTVVTSGTFDGTGSFSLTNAVSPEMNTEGMRFYLLKTP